MRTIIYLHFLMFLKLIPQSCRLHLLKPKENQPKTLLPNSNKEALPVKKHYLSNNLQVCTYVKTKSRSLLSLHATTEYAAHIKYSFLAFFSFCGHCCQSKLVKLKAAYLLFDMMVFSHLT